MRSVYLAILAFVISFNGRPIVKGQAYGQPDYDQPGDKMIQEYLSHVTEDINGKFLENVESVEDWKKLRPKYKEEYFHMLGLWPMPQKTPLKATITGTLQSGNYIVDMLHYQSRPRLYVTANLYRPKNIAEGQRLPAVLYVCGHSPRGRNGNKTAFQSHGIWFARHGYICLVLDTLQLGEIASVHHGTYREGRWWWHSRGYTPAGVECLNGIRGIDYLLSREDVDPQRIAVTGISGGGAATFWIAAADERAKVSVPVSGMADLMSYVPNWARRVFERGDRVYLCALRGVGRTRWTLKNPPNYVERSHVLLGRTVDTGRVWDIIAAARYLHGKYNNIPVYVLGEGAAGVLAAYAALWEPEIAGVILNKPPLSHMDVESPQFLNVLRVCDVPDVLGMLAPRALTIYGNRSDMLEKVAKIYSAAGASTSFVQKSTQAD